MKTVALIVLAVIIYNINKTSSDEKINFNSKNSLEKKENIEVESANKDGIRSIRNDSKKCQSSSEEENNFNLNENLKFSRNKLVKIIGLGNIERNKLENAAEIINEFYGYETIISNNISIKPEFCFDDGETLDADKSLNQLNKFDNETNLITIYITNNNLYTSYNVKLRGYTYMNGKTIIMRSNPEFIRETLIHEIGHTKGLNHCNDLTCIMAINNDNEDSGNFCTKCKKEIASKM